MSDYLYHNRLIVQPLFNCADLVLNDLFRDCCGLIVESFNVSKLSRSHLEEKGLFLASYGNKCTSEC